MKDGPRTVGDLGERAVVNLVRKIFPARGRGVLFGIGDDTAALRPGRHPLLLTKDLLVEDVDFRRDIQPPDCVGRKSLAVNLSDIAAMGGTPRAALLGLGLPAGLKMDWLRGFLEGFASSGRDHGVAVVGGDVSLAREIVVSVTVLGEAERPVKRGGARPGHEIWVSGSLGDAALVCSIIENGEDFPAGEDFLGPTLRVVAPAPRLALGRTLAVRGLATSMIDVSDGIPAHVAAHNNSAS